MTRPEPWTRRTARLLAIVAGTFFATGAWAAPGDYRQKCTPDGKGGQACRWEVCESSAGIALAGRPRGRNGITPIGAEETGGGCKWVPSEPPPKEATFCCENRSSRSGVYTNCSKILNYDKAKQEGNLCGKGRNGDKAIEVECNNSFAWNSTNGNLHDCR